MIEMRTEINIAASPAVVWAVLVDFDHHPDWNPFAISISGRLDVGEKLSMHLNRPRPTGMVFYPVVTRVAKEKAFRFLGQFVIPSLFSGEHIFELAATDDGSTRFIHREEFHGMVPAILGKSLDKIARRNYETFNRAIKQRAESFPVEPDTH
ncbi:MAG: SRPBCC domain-containing protein [Zetaproteobacteria bacterium CG_4_9_14_3_um_filter_53_7]|nr:MAG: SRPBCC domain-containing protein [Zetaproteobacteria bacterium CG_4_9_14_3_um_filter_53_7]